MDTKAGVGMSRHRNPRMAGQEAAEKALTQAGIEKPDFVFMFATIGYNQQSLLKAVREATGGAPLCGCSSEGNIAGDEVDESNFSVAVMAISSNELRFSNGVVTGLREDSGGVGRNAARAIQPELNSDTVGLFLFPDGLTCNFDRLLAGLESALSLDHFFPLWGGLAGENFQFQENYQYCNDEVVSDGLTWVLLAGQVQVACAINHGCISIGVERKITRAEGNIIYEIDGKPALEVLKEYLTATEIDNWSTALVALTLGFKAPGYMQDQDEYVIRAMTGGKDDKTGAIIILTEVPEGTSIWMTRRDQEKITAGVKRVAEEIKAQIGKNPAKLVFQFDCAGRGKVIFRDQQKTQLLKMLRQKVDPDAPWLGFFTYGEIGPVGEHNCFHNYTIVITAIY